MENTLYYGDNLAVLRDCIPDESVDLIYLDPPFNSNASYNVLFKSPRGEAVRAQTDVFEDTWRWGEPAALAFHEIMARGRAAAGILRALRSFFGESDMMAYLTNMAVRLEELQRVLKPTGTIYLHCDPTASHYLKVVMDAIFGAGQFRNEIIWKRTSAHSSARRYGPVHDVLLFYSKSDNYIWNPNYQPYDPTYVETFFDKKDKDGRRWKRTDLTGAGTRRGETGRPWRGIDVTAKGRHWAYPPSTLDQLDSEGRVHWPKKRGGMPRLKQYPEDLCGVPLQDVWTDIRPMHNLSSERLGFATQKPLTLLERIIESSSNEGDTVLDPFCGCGTAVHAAERLRRRWIGIDITHVAIQIIEGRLKAEMPDASYRVVGQPRDPDAARFLADNDKHEFQLWVAGRIGAAPEAIKKGPDRGIDGYIWYMESRTESNFAILSVKGGENVGVGVVRELRAVIEREEAGAGVLVSRAKPTRDMVAEAAAAGRFETVVGTFPRIQLFTIEDLFAGKKPKLPPTYEFATLLTLPRAIGRARKQRPQHVRKQLEMLMPLINKRFEELAKIAPDDIEVPRQRAAGRRG